MVNKLLIISSFRKQCGVGIYTYELIKRLIETNSELGIALITHKDSDLNIDGIKVFKVIDENNPFYFLKVNEVIKNEKPDIINIEWEHNLYSPLPMLGTYIFPIIKKYSKQLLISFHSLYKNDDIKKVAKKRLPFPLYNLFTYYYSLTKNFLINNSRMIRVFTYYELSQVKNKENVVLIPEGINEYEPLDMPEFNENINLLIFGFIRKGKGYEIAIPALKYLDERFKLLIVGKPKKQEFVNEIHKLAVENGVEDRVIVKAEFVSDNEKKNIYKNSHIVLTPYEIISNSGILLDCLELCRPIVSTVLKEDIKNLGIGEYSSEDPKKFAEKIEIVAENYKKYYKKIIEVRERFFWRNVIKEIIKTYDKFVEHN